MKWKIEWKIVFIHEQEVAIFCCCTLSVKWENCSERHSVTSQSKLFFLETNYKKIFEKYKTIDTVNGKNDSFKRDNFKYDIPLNGNLNTEANYYALVHWNFVT